MHYVSSHGSIYKTLVWFGWIDDELVDITDEYLEYVRNKDEDGKLKYES